MPETRPMTADDVTASKELGHEAFGNPRPGGGRVAGEFPAPGTTTWGTFDDEHLVAKATARHDASFWHGREVATCGIAGVAVAAEHRGRGLLRGVLAEALAEHGQAVSTLFPTAPGIYRSLGYEVVGSLDHVDLPTAALASVRAPAGTTVRRATAADLPAVDAAYARWAVTRNGPLTRTAACFSAGGGERLAEVSGVTLAEDDDGVVGYAAWTRGPGYGPAARLDVDDLVTLTPDAARALWRVLGSFASVAGTVRLRTSGDHPARLVLPSSTWAAVERRPYMARVHPSALGSLTAGPDDDVALSLRVAGDPLGVLDGSWALEVRPGGSAVARVTDDDRLPTLTPQGLALAYAGTLPAVDLRAGGHLVGGDERTDAALDRLLRRRAPAVLDYF
ncbi:GNAT family N-acetyltransferase [Nocardioides sp. AX2bis]|uniref:GNAT family N-acetyltransferase n=1 Tax=Nocardioides sp. AX2bis TaxID=2653157 RepID=UPI0012F19D42|nr:GNAT family N-acetyltransferase [Nocardioides sp. AX2bis]VXA92852.1 Acetyltransferase [Nocardioides sp. AX2bis]